jgi:hypothetical protein
MIPPHYFERFSANKALGRRFRRRYLGRFLCATTTWVDGGPNKTEWFFVKTSFVTFGRD